MFFLSRHWVGMAAALTGKYHFGFQGMGGADGVDVIGMVTWKWTGSMMFCSSPFSSFLGNGFPTIVVGFDRTFCRWIWHFHSFPNFSNGIVALLFFGVVCCYLLFFVLRRPPFITGNSIGAGVVPRGSSRRHREEELFGHSAGFIFWFNIPAIGSLDCQKFVKKSSFCVPQKVHAVEVVEFRIPYGFSDAWYSE